MVRSCWDHLPLALQGASLDRAQVDTLRRYVEALGGTMTLEHVGDESFTIA